MILKMDKSSTSSSWDLAQRLYDKNIELENRRRKSAQARVPSDPNAWQQMRENFETIILEDHNFSEKHSIEFALWQLHYRRIEEFRAHYNTASATGPTTSQTRGGTSRSDRASKIRLQFKTFLSEATGFYHDLILKIRSKYGLPIGQFSPDAENHNVKDKDGKRSSDIKKGLISCHRCLIYLGDLARYKGLYGEGDSKSRDYAAASSYYLQAASLWPSSGNPHHQLAILATYSGDELMAVYRYFRSLAAENPFSTARDNLIVAFEKNRQSYFQLHGDPKATSKEHKTTDSPVLTRGKGKGKVESVVQPKEPKTDTNLDVERPIQIRQTYKAFRVRFVRLNGILFTRTSLETFEEVLSLVSSSLQELLSSGSQEELSFGTEAVENGHFIVILVSILIFTVNNMKGETEGQSYADIVQHTVLLQDGLVAYYELMGQILKRCLQLSDASSSFLLPGILVCVEWMACHPEIALRSETNDKQTGARVNFLTHCISLLNKLLCEGLVPSDDENLSCFTNMTRYEEGENEYEVALWEDFELRGFLPLQPAQAFLDFSRKHSIGGDSKKDKMARVKRILAAGKALADKITIDHKTVRFDSKLKKFVIGVDDLKGSPRCNGGMRENSSDTKETMMIRQSEVEPVEGEEEDEVIVFRPTVVENQSEVLSSKRNRQENVEHVPNTSVSTSQFTHVPNTSVSTSQFTIPVSAPRADFVQQNKAFTDSQSLLPVTNCPPNFWQQDQFESPMWSANRQVSVSGGLKGLSVFENGHVAKPGMPIEVEIPNVASLSLSNQLATGTGMVQSMINDRSVSFGASATHVKNDTMTFSGSEPPIAGRNILSSLPSNSLKVSTNRPVRHHGPPPGFSSVRPKHANELNSASSGQGPPNDDYSWLDGYQLQSLMKSGFIQPVNMSSNLSSQYINGSVATNSFPFPGKQVSVAQLGEEQQGRPNLGSSNPNHEALQQQYIRQTDPQQGKSMWNGRHFV